MAGEQLARLIGEYFREKSPSIQIEEPIIEQEPILEPEFLHSKDIFNDILPVVKANEFGGLSLVGGQGNGKSFAAGEFATLAEDEGFLVVDGKFEDVMVDLESWKKKVKQAIIYHGSPELCLVLDDMSYSSGMLSAKRAATWKNFIGDIRHQFENVLGEGIRPLIFLILISHRYHSVPPIMRNSMSWIFASMNNEDRQDAQKLIPKNKEELGKLDKLYKFFLSVSSIGPKQAELGLPIKFSFGGKQMDFYWGIKQKPGNGRLMIIYHKGEMRLFNPRKIDNMVDLENYRFKVEPKSEEQKKEEFRQKVNALFPIKDTSTPITAIVPIQDNHEPPTKTN